MMEETTNETPNASPLPPAAAGSKSLGRIFWPLCAAAALGLAGWQAYALHQQQAAVQQQLAQMQVAADTAVLGAKKAQDESFAELQARLATLEAQQAELQGLQNLAQDVAQGREQALLLEVEQTITLVAQQLQLTGNVPLAVSALQGADARLARLDPVRYLPLRKALAHDIERLNVVPFVDVPGLGLRLDQFVNGVAQWPLAALARPPAPPPAVEQADASWWQRAGSSLWSELKGLVRIQRIEGDPAPLLAPGQEYFLRENLKLRLLDAKLALLAHDRKTCRDDLAAAQAMIERHFDRADQGVQVALAALRDMQAARLDVDLPDLAESRKALLALRQGKDKR